MKTYQLEETSIGGDSNPLNRRYIVDGKRVTREQFDAIRRNPRVRQECFSNSNQGGVWHFYSIAREVSA